MISNGEQSGIECERRSFKAWRRCRSYGVVQAYRGLQGPAYEREVERGAERDGVWDGAWTSGLWICLPKVRGTLTIPPVL